MNRAKPAPLPVPPRRRVASGLLQRKCACGGTPGPSGECEECQKKRLQRKSGGSPSNAAAAGTAPPIVHDVLRSPGQPLDRATRAFMEPRFGHDFSAVRVHNDARAAESARAVNAQAYTVGSNIVFEAGHQSSGNPAGNYLLAHELAHVVQQGGAFADSALAISPANDPAEATADHAARDVLSGRAPDLHSGPARLQRLGGNPGCTKPQADQIHQAIYDANSYVNKTLAALAVSPLTPRTTAALRHNFGAAGVANAATIATNLGKGRADMLKNPYSCADATDATCASAPCGYTPGAGSHTSVICTNATLASNDTVYRLGCVLHEAMHASDATMTADNYSGWFKHSGSSPVYPGADPMTNADSYTSLAMELS